jgi:hypothetical protein
VLLCFQSRAPSLRRLVDEIDTDPSEAPAIVLKWVEDDALTACSQRRLSTKEVKGVARTVLGVLEVMHGEGWVHTGLACTCVVRWG